MFFRGRVEYSIGMMLYLITVFVSNPSIVFAGLPHKNIEKKAIVLVTFGTTIPEARKELDRIVAIVKKKYSTLPVFIAYTSRTARNVLRKEGTKAQSVEEVLAYLAGEGYTAVAMQSLHVLPGKEYQDMLTIAKAMQGLPKGIETITIGKPLLSDDTFVRKVADILYTYTENSRKEAHTASLFLSHGAKEGTIGTLAIPALQYYLWTKPKKNIFVGVLEGEPSTGIVVQELQKFNIQTVHLFPLLTVVGDHFINDMQDSTSLWRTALRKANIAVTVHAIPVTVIEGITNMWLESLEEVLQGL